MMVHTCILGIMYYYQYFETVVMFAFPCLRVTDSEDILVEHLLCLLSVPKEIL